MTLSAEGNFGFKNIFAQSTVSLNKVSVREKKKEQKDKKTIFISPILL